MKVLVTAIKQEKEIKGSQIKRDYVPLCVDDMTLYTENPRDSIQKLLELKNKFKKVAGYKINTQPLQGLNFQKYKELIQLNLIKANNPIKKWAEDLKSNSSKENI